MAASLATKSSLNLPNGDVLALTVALKAGLPFKALLRFAVRSGLSLPEIAAVMQTPPRTLARRKRHGRLNGPESERLARLAALFDKAVALFEGDARAAANWLRSPVKALGRQTPLTVAETEQGARAVEDLIGRLEYGVYS